MLWNFNIFRLTIFWCLFVYVCVMIEKISLFVFVIFKIHRHLFLHWRFDAIAKKLHCNFAIVYKIQKNVFIYDQTTKSIDIHLSRKFSSRINFAIEKFLIQYLEKQSWTYQKEMMWFLWKKWNLHVHRTTIRKLLKKIKWNHKQKRRIEFQNENFRIQWFFDFLNVIAKQFVFIDESLFNEITNWRMRTYVFIDERIKYHVCINKKKHEMYFLRIQQKINSMHAHSTFNVNWLFYSNYLHCTNYKKNYYNANEFYIWLNLHFFSLCNVWFKFRNIIIMNNVNIYINSRIQQFIESYDCRVKYFSFYSSNFNSIEFNFSILKTWIRKYYHEMWSLFDDNFDDFLRYAMSQNQCNRFAKKHFKYNVQKNYIFENDIQTCNERLINDNIEFENFR